MSQEDDRYPYQIELRKSVVESLRVRIGDAEPYKLSQPRDVTYCYGPNMANKVEAYDVLGVTEVTAVVPLTKDRDNILSGILCRVECIKRDGFAMKFCTLNEKAIINSRYRQFDAYADEFVSLSLSQAHLDSYLEPLCEEEMKSLEITNDNIVHKWWGSSHIVSDGEIEIFAKCFIKKESYPCPKDCRCITEQATKYLLKLASYTIRAKKSVLKKNHWYSPGRNGDRLTFHMKKLAFADEILASDFSRFDGTQSRLLRSMLEKKFYLKCFGPEHEDVINELFELDFDAKIRIKTDEKQSITYKTDGARQSGSALTTDGNTINNAGTYYITLRCLGFDKTTAWLFTNLSLFYGDDAVFVKRIGKTYFTEAEYENEIIQLGMDLKLESCTHRRVPFLARIFDLSTESSIPDLKRALSKIGIVYVNDPRSFEQQIFDKIYGYYVNDPNHPVIKALWDVIACGLFKARAVKDLSGSDHELIFKINRGAFPAEDITDLMSTDVEELQLGNYDVICKQLINHEKLY